MSVFLSRVSWPEAKPIGFGLSGRQTDAHGEGLKFTRVQPIYIHEYRGKFAFQIVYTITSSQPPAKRKYKTCHVRNVNHSWHSVKLSVLGSFLWPYCSNKYLLVKQVSVLYFAKSAELTGLKAENITVPSNISSLQLWQHLETRHPRWIITLTTLIPVLNFQISDVTLQVTNAIRPEKDQTNEMLPLSPPIRDFVYASRDFTNNKT